jgi:nucleoside-triphosphatase
VSYSIDSPDSLLASCFFEKSTKGLIFVTGPSGSGKTTHCAEIISHARETGLSVGGILCPAVIEAGEKTGIEQVNVATGERRRLGTRSSDTSENTVGSWQMDESVLAWGNEILISLTDEEIIVIDELGPLELEEGYGYQEALCLLDEGRYRVAVVAVRPSLVTLARLRWPDAQVHFLEGESQ